MASSPGKVGPLDREPAKIDPPKVRSYGVFHCNLERQTFFICNDLILFSCLVSKVDILTWKDKVIWLVPAVITY